jgi:hypothetical protein
MLTAYICDNCGFVEPASLTTHGAAYERGWRAHNDKLWCASCMKSLKDVPQDPEEDPWITRSINHLNEYTGFDSEIRLLKTINDIYLVWRGVCELQEACIKKLKDKLAKLESEVPDGNVQVL